MLCLEAEQRFSPHNRHNEIGLVDSVVRVNTSAIQLSLYCLLIVIYEYQLVEGLNVFQNQRILIST